MTETTIGPNRQDHPEWGFTTRQVHADFAGDPTTGARTIPIYATNAFHFPNAQAAAARFGLQELEPIYSRLTSPANEVLKERLVSLEGGAGALVTSSRQSIIALALLTSASPSKDIVASQSIYGGTYSLLARTLARLSLEARFVIDPRHLVDQKDLTGESAIVYYSKVIPDPQGGVLDLEPLTNLAYDFGVPLVVDNTVPAPYLCHPIEQGTGIVVHSATKYLGRHGSTLLGAVVDAGRFDFADRTIAARFPDFNRPDGSYYNVVYVRDFEMGGALDANLAFILEAHAKGLRDLGFTASPFTVWAVGLGMDTLSLQVARRVENARAVTKRLQSLVGGGVIQTVRWSSLPSPPYYQLAQGYTPKGAGAVLGFDLTGGLEAGKRFIDSLELLANVTNIGDVWSLAIHPTSTTHSWLSGTELAARGISVGAVRISVGAEDSQDIITDID